LKAFSLLSVLSSIHDAHVPVAAYSGRIPSERWEDSTQHEIALSPQ
jgi:hypothetical protein